jgi:hypothetical protein
MPVHWPEYDFLRRFKFRSNAVNVVLHTALRSVHVNLQFFLYELPA